jgi:kinesin family member 18/19
MIGNPDSPGIMERAMNDVFKKNESVQLTKEVSIKASYIEIYNETIKDLLTTGSKPLELREDPSQGVVVTGITEIPVATTTEILNLLKVIIL